MVACPSGPGGEPLRELARRAIPVAGLPIADSRDALTVYREWPTVPLNALPHLGPAAVAAYASLPESQQCTPHARLERHPVDQRRYAVIASRLGAARLVADAGRARQEDLVHEFAVLADCPRYTKDAGREYAAEKDAAKDDPG